MRWVSQELNPSYEMSTRNPMEPIISHAAFDAFYFAGGVAFLWRIYNRAW
jgi:hypothetical protein